MPKVTNEIKIRKLHIVPSKSILFIYKYNVLRSFVAHQKLEFEICISQLK